MRILILEDENILAVSMQEFLEDCGYRVDIYNNSNRADKKKLYKNIDRSLKPI